MQGKLNIRGRTHRTDCGDPLHPCKSVYIISSVTQVRLAVATIVHSDIDVSFLLRVFILTLLSGGAAGLAIALKL